MQLTLAPEAPEAEAEAVDPQAQERQGKDLQVRQQAALRAAAVQPKLVVQTAAAKVATADQTLTELVQLLLMLEAVAVETLELHTQEEPEAVAAAVRLLQPQS